MRSFATLLLVVTFVPACSKPAPTPESPPTAESPPDAGDAGDDPAPADDDDDGGATQCRPTGCSGTVCAVVGSDIVTTCEYRAEYACYTDATCEVQADGECGWTQTPELEACLADPPPLQ